ncbi:MAG: DUF3604 domain-containing protein [Chlamydiae bacterium]|jgi:hypothetical protein|nr:DUF3604 domain-containing protein [Chlamydiota bacterium]
MARSICTVEPGVARAGEVGTWKFVFISPSHLPANTCLRFDPLSTGKAGEWQLPEASSKAKGNAIWLSLPNGKSVYPKALEIDDQQFVYDFNLPEEVSNGEKLVITIGCPPQKPGQGTLSQSFTQRRKPFHLYVDTKGKGDFKDKDPEIFSLDVRGNKLNNIRIIAPSVVFKNSRFDVFLRFEDAFGNLTGNAPEGTLIELSYEHLRENLQWKLFVPETGFLTLPNLYFNESGTYHLKLKNLSTNEIFTSPPIHCFQEQGNHLFWGSLHNNSSRFQTADEIESSLRYYRDDKAYQFYATSLDESEEATTNDDWKLTSNQVAECNEEERFVTLLGFQWVGEASAEGSRHIIYAKDNKPLLRKKDAKSNSLKKLYSHHSPKELLSIPCFTMAKGYSYDFDKFHPEFERVVEIYNSFGSSECSKKQGNPRPIQANSRKGIAETDEGSIRNALNQGFRFGFIAGGLDNKGIYKDLNEESQAIYSQGLTAILAPEYSRDALFNALYNRKCYATTGARIVVYFNIAGAPMGSELNSKDKPGLLYNRFIDGFVAGTAPLEEVAIFRNGSLLTSFKDQKETFSFETYDDEPLEKAILTPDLDKPFTYYYLRVIQKDGHIAWSSPIWIDYIPEEKKKIRKK